MKAALMVKWSGVIPGREKATAEYALEVAEYWGKAAADGKCSEPEFFVGSGDVVYWMVKGEEDDLRALQMSDDGQRLLIKGEFLLADFTYAYFDTGATAEKFIERYFAIAGELGYL